MKGKIDLKTLVSLIMAILTFSVPLITMAQQTEIDEARADAERDAQMDTNGTLWLVAGCCGGVIGLIISYAIVPSPSASRLLGKPPEYVAYYTDFYREKAKSIQTGKAWTGCGIAAVAYVAYFVFAIAVTAGSSDW